MARIKLNDLNADKCVGFGNKPGQKQAGETVEGYYIGSRVVDSGMGPSTLHILQTEQGNLGLWGSKQLNDKLALVPQENHRVFVTYTRTIKAGKGTMKVFDVEYDNDDKLGSSAAQVSFSASSSEDEEGIYDSSEIVEDDLEEQYSTRAVASNAVQASKSNGSSAQSDQKARAQALLQKRR